MQTGSTPTWTPDYRRLLAVVTGRERPDRLPFIDLRADDGAVEKVLGEAFGSYGSEAEQLRRRADLLVRCAEALTFDCVWARVSVPFPGLGVTIASDGRQWIHTGTGAIGTRADFESYAWPEPGVFSPAMFEALADRAPDGMGIFSTTSGVFENATRLLGPEGFAYAMADDPDLVRDVFAAVGERVLAHFRGVAAVDCVRLCWMGEDMGHRTGLLASPAFLREHVFPWHRRIVEAVHGCGKPFVLHSCGNLREIMGDLMDIGIDAKHSFEDAIMPVTEAVRLYGRRIGLLGGIDVHLLAHGTEEDVRAATRRTIEACAPSGRWALGSGNTFTDYIPVGNYLAMLDEGRKKWA